MPADVLVLDEPTNDLDIPTLETLEEALELFKLPRTVGEFEGKDVVIGLGRFGLM